MIRILIGSPIRQEKEILEHFIKSLEEVDKQDIEIDYYFVDDNDDIQSSDLLSGFAQKADGNVIIEQGEKIDQYIRTEDTHYWKEQLVWKIAEYKNRIIQYSRDEGYDYLFLLDSDILLHPKTILHLMQARKDIISEVFWTKWHKNSTELPQVWLYDQYSLIPKERHEVLNQIESDKRYISFLKQLREPGIYPVGGLGACTLISRKAIEKGVSFDKIYNLTFWGEDRHFCIRAAALGLQLYVDTVYPAYHIYRMEDIKGVKDFWDQCKRQTEQEKQSDSSLIFDMENLAKHFLMNFYVSDYRRWSQWEGSQYLSTALRNTIEKKAEKIKQWMDENQISTSIFISDIRIHQYLVGNAEATLICRFRIYVEGRVQTVEDYQSRLMFQQDKDNRWLIHSIEIFDNQNRPIFGFSIKDIADKKIRICKEKDNKLTLTMLVRNEGKKFLRQVLAHAAQYIDEAVILDDASEDDTVEICKEVLKNIPLTLVSNKEQGFHNEIALRKQLWDMTVKTNPDWILSLDADEIFEDSICKVIKSLMNQAQFDYYAFRLYDMWDENHYREDKYWQAHQYYRTFLIRYQPNFQYGWKETPIHCGRIPENIFSLRGCLCYTRLKHLGWSTKELREEKMKRYMEVDQEGTYGVLEQYKSILDEKPTLIPWE